MHTFTLTPRDAARLLAETLGLTASEPLIPVGSELASTFHATIGAREVAVKMQAASPKELAVQRWRASVASHLSAQGHAVPSTMRARDGTIVRTITRSGSEVATTASDGIVGTPYAELGDQLDAVAFGRALGTAATRLQATLVGAQRPPCPIQHIWAAHTMSEPLAAHLPRATDPEVVDIAIRAPDLLERVVSPRCRGASPGARAPGPARFECARGRGGRDRGVHRFRRLVGWVAGGGARDHGGVPRTAHG